MSQNIYDHEIFFAGYSRLPRSLKGLDGAPEWPALQAMLPPMAGKRVIDLGCGFGWFCRWARQAGAGTVLGLDLSEKMLARAASETTDPAVIYRRADLEGLELEEGAYDLAYSSLAFHYVVRFDALLSAVHAALVPGGRLVFSMEHPLYTAPSRPSWRHDEGHVTWPLDNYLAEGPRVTDWLAPGVIKQHRTIGTVVSSLLAAGFILTALQEWGPTDAQIAERPEWAQERHRPAFLLLAADKT